MCDIRFGWCKDTSFLDTVFILDCFKYYSFWMFNKMQGIRSKWLQILTHQTTIVAARGTCRGLSWYRRQPTRKMQVWVSASYEMQYHYLPSLSYYSSINITYARRKYIKNKWNLPPTLQEVTYISTNQDNTQSHTLRICCLSACQRCYKYNNHVGVWGRKWK